MDVRGYELHERIGSGGFGVVHRAYQSTVGREVAIKIILPHFANQPDFIRRFEIEAQLVARLEHLHIVPLYDYWRDPDGAYLVMRLLRGGNLKSLLANGPMELPQVAKTVEQLAAGLSAAHRNGVIHRDIKPSNILMDEDGNAYLSDFGIAKDLSRYKEQTESDIVKGSPGYLSPEQARSEPVSERTDVYSLGVVLYEMLCGEHPFPDANPVERIYKHLNEPLPLMPNIDHLDASVTDSLNEIIQKATAKNPLHRYADALEFAAALRPHIVPGQTYTPESIVEQLTRREQEILQLIIDGLSNQEIADRLYIAIGTVKWYNRQIYKKLHVRNRVQAIHRARELDFVFGGVEEDEDSTSYHTYVTLPEPENPYKGLQAFQVADARDFFGRDKIIQKLVNHLDGKEKSARFLTVVGPSGSGKSSLVKAGLIPALLRGDIPGSDRWFIADMIPGARPLDELEIALTRVANSGDINLHEQLTRDENGLLRLASLLLPDDDSELVIVIDQFEEVFTLVPDEMRRTQFLDLIRAAVTDPRSRVRVVVTLRADFYDRPLHYPEFGELVRNCMETVLPLSAHELEQAIVKPAEHVGVTYEDGLVPRMIDEVLYQPGALPLLQYALTELFERRDGRKLTNDAYQTIGGTIGALAKRADELYEEQDEAGKALVHQLFLRLVTLGEGTEDTRRRATQAELLSLTDAPDQMDEIIAQFADYRLLLLDHDPNNRAPTVEVAHEAILREWDRLRGWLNDSRDDIKTQRQLSALSAEWEKHEQSGDYLVRGARLDQLQLWSAETSLILTPSEQAFLDASIAERERRQANEQEQAKRESNLQLRARRVLQGLVAVFLIAAMVSAGLAYYSDQQRQKTEDALEEADRQRAIAENERDNAAQAQIDAENKENEAREAASRAEGARALDLLEEGFYNEAVESSLTAIEFDDTPEAFGVLGEVISSYQPFTSFVTEQLSNGSQALAVSPDGTSITYSQILGEVAIIDTKSGNHRILLNFDSDLCREKYVNLKWHNDGETILIWASPILSTNESCTDKVLVANASTGITELLLTDFPEDMVWADWSPDGSTILTASLAGNLYFWDVASGALIDGPTPTGNDIHTVAWSTSSNLIASASRANDVTILDVANGETLTFTSGVDHISSIDWSPDGNYLAVGNSDGVVRKWNARTGILEEIYTGINSSAITFVAWSLDGSKIGAVTNSSLVFVWNESSSNLITSLRTSGGSQLDWSSDGNKLVVSTSQFTYGVDIFEISESCVPDLPDISNVLSNAAWSPDGEYISTGTTDGFVRIWEVATCELAFEIEHATNGKWSPDSSKVRVINRDTTASVWDVKKKEFVTEFNVEPGMVIMGASWSSDGTHVALQTFCPGDCERPILVWDINKGEIVHDLLYEEKSGANCFFPFPAWSADSTKIAAACVDFSAHEPVVIWDTTSGAVIGELTADAVAWRAQWFEDTSLLLVGYFDGTVRVWDTVTGEEKLRIETAIDRMYPAWSPDGRFIVSSSLSGKIEIWDARTGELIYGFTAPGEVLSVDWSPDGDYIVLGGLFNPIIKRVWTSKEELIEYAYDCCVPYRELTNEERARYGLLPE